MLRWSHNTAYSYHLSTYGYYGISCITILGYPLSTPTSVQFTLQEQFYDFIIHSLVYGSLMMSIVSRVHNIYTERECPTLHMLCTNTLRKVMMQQPLTAKVLIKLKPHATLKFWQTRACNVLKMRVDWGVIISSSLMWKVIQTIGDDDEEFLKMGAVWFWKKLKERTRLGKYWKSALILTAVRRCVEERR